MHDDIEIFGVSVENGNNPFDYKSFNSLPFCKIGNQKIQSSLGEEKTFTKLGFNMTFNKNVTKNKLCSLKISNRVYKRMYNYTMNNLWMHLLLKHVSSYDLYSQIGYQKLDYDNNFETYIFSHFNFDIAYNNHEKNLISSVNLTSTYPQKIQLNMTLNFTYSVNWIYSVNNIEHIHVNKAFFHSSTRFLIFTACFCFMGLLYFIYSSSNIKLHQTPSYSTMSLVFSSSGLNILIAFSLCFIINAIMKQTLFTSHYKYIVTALSSFISGYFSYRFNICDFQHINIFQYFVFYILLVPFLYFIFDILMESYHFKVLFISSRSIQQFFIMLCCNVTHYFGIYISKLVNSSYKNFLDYEKGELSSKQHVQIKITITSIILSLFIGFSTLLFTVSESYFIFTGYMKRKDFDLWLIPFTSLLLLYINNWFEIRIICSLFQNENSFTICFLSSLFSFLFNFLAFVYANGTIFPVTYIFGIIFSTCIAFICFSSYYNSLYV